ncbi:MAG: peptidyl-prolyl cis-trans isomerase [Candidatus Latescibacterota bacterium]|nr:peptidyl-prolyl cis-trans isomerase [Candidatus Latescibacterota bacterium]
MFILIFLMVAGCQSDKESNVVGRVGTELIYLEDLREFESVATDSTKLSFEQHVDYLETLVDRELLLCEAKDRSLQINSELQFVLMKDSEARLAEIVYTREIDERAIPSDSEIEVAKATGGWNEHVVSVELFLDNLKRAEEVRSDILNGMDVYEAGRLYSLDRTMHIPMGGAQQFVYNRYDGPEEIVQRVFQIPVGALSTPIKFRQGYILAYCAERRSIDPSEIEEAIILHLKRNKKEMLRGAFLQHLNNSLNLNFDKVGLIRTTELLSVKSIKDRKFVKNDSNQVSLSYGSQTISVVDLVGIVVNVSFDGKTLSTTDLITSLKNKYLPQMLLAEHGRKSGADDEDNYKKWFESRREDLMISLLRRELCKEIEVSQEEILNRYAQTKSRFAIPSYARVRDVLVEKESLANLLKTRVDSGEDFGEIIKAHTLRSGRKRKGMFRVFALQSEQYGTAWINYAMNIPLNEIHGPVKAEGGYSLIEVIERVKDQFYTLDESRVRDAVVRDVRSLKERAVFNKFLKKTRSDRADEIEIFDRIIKVGFGL